METATASDLLPVALFINWISATPGVARLALSTGDTTVVSLTRVVVRGLPFQRTTVALLMCAPTIWTDVLSEPAAMVCGMIWLIAGMPAVAIPTPPQPTTKKQNPIVTAAPTLVNIFKMHPWPVKNLFCIDTAPSPVESADPFLLNPSCSKLSIHLLDRTCTKAIGTSH